MKRKAISDEATAAGHGSTSGRNLPPKRSKTNQACTSCKKNKTRCEVLDASQISRQCHRCKVLDLPCSFEAAATFIVPQSVLPSSDLHNAALKNSPGEVESYASTSNLQVSDYDIERLELPVPPNASWGKTTVHGAADWLATPMFAIQKVAIQTSTSDAFMTQVDEALRDILTLDGLQSLLYTFENKLSPWLNLQPHQPDNTFHRLACCLVASRLLDATTRARIVPRLQKLLDQVLSREAFNPTPSAESIQAMMILALWTPVGGQAEARDGRLLIASAVSMAVNLRINQSVAYLARIEGHSDFTQTPDLEDTRNNARLWLALMNAESLLSIQTGRDSLPYRTASDYDVINWSSNMTINSGRDIRLALIGQLFGIAEMGLRINFQGKAEIDTFYKEVVDVLAEFDKLSRLITPLSAVTEHEGFQFFVMQMEYRACRILVLQRCLREIRRVYAQDGPAPYRHWYRKVITSNGTVLPAVWGEEVILLAQEVLASALSRKEQIAEFSTAPDSIFALICFSAALLVVIKMSAYQSYGEPLPGLSDSLLTRISDLLTRTACGPDHVPAKCAHLISALVRTYEARIRIPLRSDDGDRDPQETSPSRVSPHTDRPPLLVGLVNSATDHEQRGLNLHSSRQAQLNSELPILGSGMDMNRVMNSDIMLDSDFWASFMNNLQANGEEIQQEIY